jgi:hypothetical protein
MLVRSKKQNEIYGVPVIAVARPAMNITLSTFNSILCAYLANRNEREIDNPQKKSGMVN